MSSDGDLPESITRVHRLATLITNLNREDAAAAGIVIAAASSPPGLPPATRAVIDALPRVAARGAVSDRSCVICLEIAAAGTDVSEMPCKHRFHPDCLSGWLLIHGSCPVCRYVIGEADPVRDNRFGSGSSNANTDADSGSDLVRQVPGKGMFRSWIVCVMFLALGIWFSRFSATLLL